MKPRHLVNPQGVTFTGWHVPNFEICNWDRDPNNPQPCPLVIHLPAGDLGDKELSDAAALKRAGWEQQDNGNLLLRASKGQVCKECYPGRTPCAACGLGSSPGVCGWGRGCGQGSCEAQIKTDTQATIRNIPMAAISSPGPGGSCVRCDSPAQYEVRFAKSY